jgi:hypothetical protein
MLTWARTYIVRSERQKRRAMRCSSLSTSHLSVHAPSAGDRFGPTPCCCHIALRRLRRAKVSILNKPALQPARHSLKAERKNHLNQ